MTKNDRAPLVQEIGVGVGHENHGSIACRLRARKLGAGMVGLIRPVVEIEKIAGHGPGNADRLPIVARAGAGRGLTGPPLGAPAELLRLRPREDDESARGRPAVSTERIAPKVAMLLPNRWLTAKWLMPRKVAGTAAERDGSTVGKVVVTGAITGDGGEVRRRGHQRGGWRRKHGRW